MIVLSADMHESWHTVAGVAARTGEVLGDKTVSVGVAWLCPGAAVSASPSAAIGRGRWRTAGTSRARLSGS